jgi:hypothetical protein
MRTKNTWQFKLGFLLGLLFLICGNLQAKWVINTMEDNDDVIYTRKPHVYVPPPARITNKPNITSSSQIPSSAKSNLSPQNLVSHGTSNIPPVFSPSNRQLAVKMMVSNIGFIRDEHGILLHWTSPPESGISQFGIYRSPQMISDQSLLNADSLIGKTSWPATEFTDRLQGFGSYFYAVTAIGTNGNEHTELIPGQSFTTNAAEAGHAVIRSVVSGLRVISTSNAKVFICWDSMGERGLIYKLYRNTSPITDSIILQEPITSTSSNCIQDFLPAYGSYFYAVTTVSNYIEKLSIVPGENTIISPVTWERPLMITNLAGTTNEKTESAKKKEALAKIRMQKNPDWYEQDLLIILRDYYTQDYASTIIRLEKFLKDKNCPKSIKNRAKLFYAKSLFYTGNFKEAVDRFVELIPVYPEEAGFWLSKSIDKL